MGAVFPAREKNKEHLEPLQTKTHVLLWWRKTTLNIRHLPNYHPASDLTLLGKLIDEQISNTTFVRLQARAWHQKNMCCSLFLDGQKMYLPELYESFDTQITLLPSASRSGREKCAKIVLINWGNCLSNSKIFTYDVLTLKWENSCHSTGYATSLDNTPTYFSILVNHWQNHLPSLWAVGLLKLHPHKTGTMIAKESWWKAFSLCNTTFIRTLTIRFLNHRGTHTEKGQQWAICLTT